MADIIPFEDRDGWLWLDGKMVPWKEARIHVLTHGLHFASCVFEGERMYSGRIYKLDEHTDRLFASAKALEITIPYTKDEINRACYEAADAQGAKDAYLRPVVFRGATTMPTVSAQKAGVRVAIAAWPWGSYFDPKEKLKGIRLDISEWKRPAPDTIPCKAKAAGLYMICTLSKHAAEAKGYADAMMFDHRGLVAEATGANIFFIKDGQIHTPSPDCFLDGITRRSVIQLARARQIPVVERAITRDELGGFEECFLTGTAAEVTPVSEIGPYRFRPGEISETLMNDYADEVRRAPAEPALSASA
jgi:branched-chain amino acid aminotransferase